MESISTGDSEITAECADGSIETKSVTVIRPKWVFRTFDPEKRLVWQPRMKAYLTIYDQLRDPIPAGITVDETINNNFITGAVKSFSHTGSGITKPGGKVTDTFGLVFTRKERASWITDQTISIGNWQADLITHLYTYMADEIFPTVRMSGTRRAVFE